MKHQTQNGFLKTIQLTGLVLALTAIPFAALADDPRQFPHPGQNPGNSPGQGPGQGHGPGQGQGPGQQNPGQGPGQQNPGQGQGPGQGPGQGQNPQPRPTPTPTPSPTPVYGHWDIECGFSASNEKGKGTGDQCKARARVCDETMANPTDDVSTLDEMAALDDIAQAENGEQPASDENRRCHDWLQVACGKGELFKGLAQPKQYGGSFLIKGVPSPEFPHPPTLKLDELDSGYVSGFLYFDHARAEGVCKIKRSRPPVTQ